MSPMRWPPNVEVIIQGAEMTLWTGYYPYHALPFFNLSLIAGTGRKMSDLIHPGLYSPLQRTCVFEDV